MNCILQKTLQKQGLYDTIGAVGNDKKITIIARLNKMGVKKIGGKILSHQRVRFFLRKK